MGTLLSCDGTDFSPVPLVVCKLGIHSVSHLWVSVSLNLVCLIRRPDVPAGHVGSFVAVVKFNLIEVQFNILKVSVSICFIFWACKLNSFTHRKALVMRMLLPFDSADGPKVPLFVRKSNRDSIADFWVSVLLGYFQA